MKKMVSVIAFIEVLIGASTIIGLILHAVLALSTKPVNVFIFVFVSALASTLIGYGLFVRREWARCLLVFFSGYIIITKIMIFTGLLQFSGEIITAVPADVKNWVSVSYHCFIIVFLSEKPVRNIFR